MSDTNHMYWGKRRFRETAHLFVENGANYQARCGIVAVGRRPKDEPDPAERCERCLKYAPEGQ